MSGHGRYFKGLYVPTPIIKYLHDGTTQEVFGKYEEDFNTYITRRRKLKSDSQRNHYRGITVLKEETEQLNLENNALKSQIQELKNENEKLSKTNRAMLNDFELIQATLSDI